MSDNLYWVNDRRKLSDLLPHYKNPRTLSDKQFKKLKKSLKKFNLVEVPAINLDNEIIAGHQRVKVLMVMYGGDLEIDVRAPNRMLSEKELEEYLIRSNENTGSWDKDMLANEWEIDDLLDWGFEESQFAGASFIEDEPPVDEKKPKIEVRECPECGAIFETKNAKVL